MSPLSRALSIVLSVVLLVFVVHLVRSRALKEKYSILWLVTGCIVLILALFDRLLYTIIALLGIHLPINGVLFFGLFFVIIINVHYSVVISRLVDQNKKIIQRLSLLEREMKQGKG